MQNFWWLYWPETQFIMEQVSARNFRSIAKVADKAEAMRIVVDHNEQIRAAQVMAFKVEEQ